MELGFGAPGRFKSDQFYSFTFWCLWLVLWFIYSTFVCYIRVCTYVCVNLHSHGLWCMKEILRVSLRWNQLAKKTSSIQAMMSGVTCGRKNSVGFLLGNPITEVLYWSLTSTILRWWDFPAKSRHCQLRSPIVANYCSVFSVREPITIFDC